MKSASALAALWLAATCAALSAQVVSTAPGANTMPTADFGFNLPTTLGSLSYSLSGSEMVETGYGNGTYASTAISGNLAYLSRSEKDPFSAVYSGGYLHGDLPGNNQNTTFQDLAVSQVFRTRSWVYVVSDAVTYLPESPTTGISGVAGVGDIGVLPVQGGIGPDQTALTEYGTRVGNGLSGSATWQLTSSTDLQGSASWQILKFLGTTAVGYDTDQYAFTFGPSYRLNALSSVGANVSYTRQTYPGYTGAFIETEGLSLQYNRTWTRKFTTSIAVGPTITHGQTSAPIPSRVDFAANISASYAGRHTGYYVGYARGINGGSGVYLGALTDVVSGGVTRPLGRSWSLGMNGAWARNVPLAALDGLLPPTTTEVFGGAQVSRRLSETFSCFISYTGIDQTLSNSNGAPAGYAYSGFNNVLGFGITYSPAPLLRSR